LLARYFSFDQSSYVARDALRRAARWRWANVLAAPEPGPWDLVLCRNLAIYLQPDAVARLWAGLAAVVRPGGLLVSGKAERPVGQADLEPEGPCIYRRVEATNGAAR
jgi:chemotaxis methyl-accepting protein methylase